MKEVDLLRQNMRRLIKLRGIPYSHLSLQIGMGETFVKDVINGKSSTPNVFAIHKVAKFLGVTVEELISSPLEHKHKPDADKLTKTLDVLLPKYLKLRKEGLTLSNKQFARIIIMTYSKYLNEEEALEKADIIQLFQEDIRQRN